MSSTNGDGPSTVVVGFDGSESSRRALAFAAGVARRNSSTLICAHVRQARGVAIGESALTVGGGTVLEAVAAADRAVAEHLGQDVAQIAELRGVTAKFVELIGDPAGVLIGIAAEGQADAIVVGASTHFGHRVFGSIAIRIVRHAPCPVTVVP
jgi:nucleotide-binding universal stress UspA family protein